MSKLAIDCSQEEILERIFPWKYHSAEELVNDLNKTGGKSNGL